MNERRMMMDRPGYPRDQRADALLDLLRGRRTIFDFLPDVVPSDLLEEAVDAGRFAPNHKLTEPWRFTLVGPETKERTGTAWAASAVGRLPADCPAERVEEVRRGAKSKWMSKPSVVVVTQVIDGDPFRAEEDYAAVACAIQNVQLAAWAMGIGCQWSTNPGTRDADVLSQLGIGPEERVVAFLFFGYPRVIPEARRTPLEAVLRKTP